MRVQRVGSSRRVSRFQVAVAGIVLSVGVCAAASADSYTITGLGTLGGSYSVGASVNNSGQVTGYSATVSGNPDAFLYSNGVMHDLGTLGGSYSYGEAINDSGQVAGDSSATASGNANAFLYSNGTMHDLGTLGGSNSEGFGINDSGQVTGWSDTAGGQTDAFLYSNGSMVDLNSLIPANSGWTLRGGLGINDAGQITGYGNYNGQSEAFILTPVALSGTTTPLPSTAYAGIGLLGLAGAWWFARRRRQIAR